MSVCPRCGVAVVPGYVRCPKCHAPLPRVQSRLGVGGTTVAPGRRRFPLLVVLAAAAIGTGIIIYLGVRGGGKERAVAPTPPAAETGPAPTAAPAATPPEAAQPTAAARAPDPQTLANELERRLRRQRLWSTVDVVGARVDVRSGSCGDPAMKPVLDAAAAGFKAAGLTKLRCLEQSGRVVTDREL